MNSRYAQFDRSRLKLQPLSHRQHDLGLENWLRLDEPTAPYEHADMAARGTPGYGARARSGEHPSIWRAPAQAGVNRHIIALMERGLISHIAMNGAGAIHDFELALTGQTTESVARYIRSGEFRLWQETGMSNDWLREAGECGFGEVLCRRILESDFPHVN
jgi:hypothetical protein